jgi:ribonuclease HII
LKKAEREKYLQEKLIDMKACEKQLHLAGFTYIAGTDEVGRGPLAGPVVAAAVVLPEDFSVLGVDDSKKLSEKKREELYDQILDKALAYGFGQRDNNVIDEINILEATKLSMLDAIAEADKMLLDNTGEIIGHVLIDALKLDALEKPQTAIIKGDSKCVSIAAASIIAKVRRDRMMRDYSQEYPGYDFEKNKGYGTRSHYEGISRLGITPIHRKTFLKNLNL